MGSSSSEDEDSSTTRAFPRGTPCSNTVSKGGEKTLPTGDPGDGGDTDDTDRGVLASLGVGLPSVEGEHSHLRPLLSSIVGKQRARERNLSKRKTRERRKRVGSHRRMRELFIAQEASRRFSNGCYSGSHTSI
jgi:hypothetical protein